VPKRTRWAQILPLKTEVGNALNKALADLENENTELDGVLKRPMASLGARFDLTFSEHG
jgi:hypothetical protein